MFDRAVDKRCWDLLDLLESQRMRLARRLYVAIWIDDRARSSEDRLSVVIVSFLRCIELRPLKIIWS